MFLYEHVVRFVESRRDKFDNPEMILNAALEESSKGEIPISEYKSGDFFVEPGMAEEFLSLLVADQGYLEISAERCL